MMPSSVLSAVFWVSLPLLAIRFPAGLGSSVCRSALVAWAFALLNVLALLHTGLAGVIVSAHSLNASLSSARLCWTSSKVAVNLMHLHALQL